MKRRLGDRAVISRRAILSGLVVATVGAPRLAFAQTPRAVRRVVLYTAIPRWKDNVIEGLRDLGWVDGRNVVVEWRTTVDAYEADLRQMLQRPVDVLIVGGPVAIRAAMTMTDKVPIVAIDLESDPVASGFGKSLGRPGKNVSGIWMDLPQLAGKQLQFLQETVPGLSRVGVVWDDRIGAPQWTETRSAARALNLSVQAVALHEVAQTDDVMKRTLVERPQALLFLTAPVVLRALPRLAALAIQYRLPSISLFSTYPESGGLMAYGPDFPGMFRQLSSYVDRILRGANVGDLPIERPSKFVLIVNVKTAKALGLTIPQSLLMRADEIIQ